MRSQKPWTKKDYEFLEDKWGVASIPAIAENLGRSVNAVKIRANRRGLGNHLYAREEITVFQLSKAIGKSYGTVMGTWVKHGLPVKYRKSIVKKYAVIHIEDFWEWAKRNKQLINFSKFEENMLGIEPDWAKQKRGIDFKGKRKKEPWTKAEDERLKKYLSMYEYTYDRLGRELNRTEGAIKRRILDLGLKHRPIKRDTALWTQDETQTLLEMYNAGCGFDAIGERLGRSGLAARGKYERLQNPDYMKRYNRRLREQARAQFTNIAQGDS